MLSLALSRYNDMDHGNEESPRGSDGKKRRKRKGEEALSETAEGHSQGRSGGTLGRQEAVEAAALGADKPGDRLGRQEAVIVAVDAAIDEDIKQNPSAGSDVGTFNVVTALTEKDAQQWTTMLGLIGFLFINDRYRRKMNRSIKSEAKSEAKQGILAFPEYKLAPAWIKVGDTVKPLPEATLQESRESEAEHKARIKKMLYPRYSEEFVKREKAAWRQHHNLNEKVAPLTAGDEEAKMGPAMERLKEQRESEARKARVKGGKTGGRGRKRST
jgi:hypothetical protein